jgi:hypothetical protein
MKTLLASQLRRFLTNLITVSTKGCHIDKLEGAGCYMQPWIFALNISNNLKEVQFG